MNNDVKYIAKKAVQENIRRDYINKRLDFAAKKDIPSILSVLSTSMNGVDDQKQYVLPGESTPAVLLEKPKGIYPKFVRLLTEAYTVRPPNKTTAMTTVERKTSGIKQMPWKDVIVGDIVHLTAGDIVPADVRIIKASDFFVNQTIVSGDSQPVRKTSGPSGQTYESYADFNDVAFMGSIVICGTATGVVILTGNDTVLLSMIKPERSREQNRASANENFNICRALLHFVTTIRLAKRMVYFAEKQIYVKNIRSLRQLGAMDILCTDKTKTITQNKVILEYDMNIRTQEDAAVLRYAYLNSYYQTGVKNLMDHAIIKQTEEKSKSDARLKDLLVYEKVDEIPFDSIRQKISVAIRNEENECRLITKGAVDKVLAACTYVQYNNTTAAITDELRRKILRKADHIGKNGMRLIAVAHKVMVSSGRTLSEKDESGMIFDGYLSFLDPPGENAANAVKAFSGQGIPVKILTGDDRQVTLSACKHIGLRSDNMLLGSDVGKMSDSELSKVTEKVNVFAELSEDQKSRIVRILKKNSHTVGFLGGGVHDISSMRAADIGISDETAIPAAKVSADIILPEKSLTLLHEVTKTAKDTILTIGAVSQPSYVSMAKES